MATYQELAAQKAELARHLAAIEAQAEAALREERAGVIETIRGLMEQHGIKLTDLGATARTRTAPAARKGGSRKGTKVPAKYRDADGHEWSGRGLKPLWLRAKLMAGANLDDFKVAA